MTSALPRLAWIESWRCRLHLRRELLPGCPSLQLCRYLMASAGPTALLAAMVSLAAVTRAAATAVVQVDTTAPLSEVGELFMGMTTDWWLDYPDAP